MSIIVSRYPRTAAETRAALGFGTFRIGWLCDDLVGNLMPAYGGLPLVASGSGIVYGDTGPGGENDKAIRFGAPRTGQFGGGSAFDVSSTDDLVVVWVGMWISLPILFGTMFGKVTPTFTNGWAVSGTDGTMINFGLGPGSTRGVSLFNLNAFHIGSWHVGVAAIDRVVGRAGVGTRSFAGTTVSASNGIIGATSLVNASNFFVGKSDWVPANDTFRLAALFIGDGPGAATGIPANLSTALQSFATYITRFDNYKAKLMRRMLPPPYKRDFGAVIPNTLTVIGQSDNLIGGLFGKDDFLPDEG